ncbi:MAG: hypothetical protein CUN56_00905 [Phototrophicales bacterium]|nr:MAG: hypothetical protein CUN56_00905 [Phototrophicales bacterium]RMG74432.1 MAG: hybrid sensor histidine kinase/response regulator [Chloroflexota bacterium]
MDEILATVQQIETHYQTLVASDLDDETAEDVDEIRIGLESIRSQLDAIQDLPVEQYPKSIVHDLRSPVGAISGFTEIMLDTDPLTDEQEAIVEQIHHLAVTLRDMITTYFRRG